ncbi:MULTISPECIES: hypothetical protein [unclassified Acinetobacter]|uniref:hypothetical protein n=1 Tax=unclassified Acinetobacter TaxID=196816 RepID=UPI00257888DE|nr:MULTISPECIES: hypothetical protein [unclassified Acinetobacter]MDM1756590.1 hypothetical protein [Acinetobacter sp. 256-1]MDM1759684.1 hypothetical protein [Acinetobacter sp. 251-1]
MSKQPRFLCIGGFLNGTQVKDQGESFVCIENGKKITYFKKEIFNQDAWDHDYYVCETTSDLDAKKWVFDIQ